MSEAAHQARHSSTARAPAEISEAMLTLNRLGYVVDGDGRIRVDGIPVQLVVRNGNVIAEAPGVTMPFSLLAQTLKPVARKSYPPVGIGRDGVPSWERDAHVKPRKDQRITAA